MQITNVRGFICDKKVPVKLDRNKTHHAMRCRMMDHDTERVT